VQYAPRRIVLRVAARQSSAENEGANFTKELIMLKAFTTVASIAVLAGAATVSIAQPGRGGLEGDGAQRGPRGPHGGMMERGERGDRPERPALEGVGADVATACIEAMGNARRTAHEAIRERTQNGVEAIRLLHENEAPNEAIELAGRQATEAIGAAVIMGDTVVSNLALQCVQTLRENGAEQRTILAVIRVREGNQGAVLEGGMRGSMVIRRAVGVATGRIDLEAKDGQRGQRGPRGPHGRGGPMHERGPIDEDADGVNEM
jgi:hypothetical protein